MDTHRGVSSLRKSIKTTVRAARTAGEIDILFFAEKDLNDARRRINGYDNLFYFLF